jgi:hypothetical protein
MKRFRIPLARGIALREAPEKPDVEGLPTIDRERGIIRGASAIQAVEALGHDLLVDDVALGQVVKLGNAAPNGVKVRYTHPGMCSDGLGKLLGRQRDFRIEGDKAVGDIHLAAVSATSPEGDLRGYVLDLAEEDPAAFAMSIVFLGHSVWKLKGGKEIRSDDPSLRREGPYGYTYERPEDATTEIPFARVESLHASDIVDEPAANRDGLFGARAAVAALSSTTGADASAAFEQLDELRTHLGLSVDDAQQFIARYFAARAPAPTAGAKPAIRKDASMEFSKERLAELCKAHPAHQTIIVECFTAGKSPSDALAAIEQAERVALNAQLEDNKKLLGEAKAAIESQATAHKAEVEKLTKANAELSAKVAKLSGIADAPADPGPSDQPAGDAKPLDVAKLGQATTAELHQLLAGGWTK